MSKPWQQVLPGNTLPRWSKYCTRNRSLALMLLAQSISSLMAVGVKLLSTRGNMDGPLEPRQILLMIMTISLVLNWIWMFCTRIPDAPLGPRSIRLLLTVRGVAGVVGIWGFYYSLQALPLSEATVVNFLAPLIAALATSCRRKSRTSFSQALASLVSIGGVVLIVHPWDILLERVPVLCKTCADIALPQHIMGVLAALVGAIGGALGYLILASIGKTAHANIPVYHLAAWTVFGTSFSYIITGAEALRFPSLFAWSLLALLGIAALLMHTLVAASLQQEGGSRALIVVYMQILFALIMDKIVWGHNPAGKSLLGGALILGSVAIVATSNEQEAPAKGAISGRGISYELGDERHETSLSAGASENLDWSERELEQ